MSTAIAIGTRVYLIVDANERSVMQTVVDRSTDTNLLYGIGDCDEELDTLRQLAQMFGDHLEDGVLGSSPHIGTQPLDSSYAGGAYFNEQGADLWRRASDAYAAYLEGPCRPLNAAYEMEAAQEAAAQAENAAAAVRIVRDDPDIASVTVSDTGVATATTDSGEVFSIGNLADGGGSSGGPPALLVGLAVAFGVVGVVWLLFKGRR